MLTSPLDQREAHANFALGAGSAASDPTAGAPRANILDRSRDDLAALIATQELSLPVVLLALGISGGLLPCPSALVVLLAAISLQRVALGLLLTVAFSAGLAGVLTGIGLLLVYAGRQFERVRAPGGLVRLLPAGSALVVTALGMVILFEALGQVGLLR